MLFVARLTSPVKSLMLVRLIDDPPGEPARTVTLVGEAKIAKSVTLTVTTTVWEIEPPVPVIVTVKLPLVVELTVSVEFTFPPRVSVTVVGFRELVSPGDVTVRETGPVKPLRLKAVIVAVALDPAITVTEVVLEVRVKLGGTTLTNLTVVGDEPSVNSRSRDIPGPVDLMFVT